MFEIDKEKFGTFVAHLRKEKGLMQKDVAQKLFVSDKAVSKWERGLSIPDVALLVPLAELLGVTVTELLECRRLPKDAPMDSRQTEDLVKRVIGLSGEEQRIHRPDRLKRGLQLLACAAIGCLEILLLVRMGFSRTEIASSLATLMVLMTVFGFYFCVFIKEKLPEYYDKNRISGLFDGFIKIHVPGVYFNNRNWPHIVRAVQLWAMIGLVASPAAFFVLFTFFPKFWQTGSVYIILAATLGGLFLPMVYTARKYEFSPEEPRPKAESRRDWIWISISLAVFLLIVLLSWGGITARGSGVQVGWTETNTPNEWSARYAYHDGYQQRNVNTDGGETTLWVEIVTTKGSIGILVTDEEEQVIFRQTDIETSSFEIPLQGKATVRITGEDHKGSFFLNWQ